MSKIHRISVTAGTEPAEGRASAQKSSHPQAQRLTPLAREGFTPTLKSREQRVWRKKQSTHRWDILIEICLTIYLFNKDIHRLSNRAFLCLFVSFLFFCFMFLVGSKKKNVDMYFKNKIVFFQSCLSLLKFFSCEVCLTRTILINNCCLLIKISEHPHIVPPCPEICLLVTMLPSTLSIALAPMRALMCAEWHSILERVMRDIDCIVFRRNDRIFSSLL